jgi:hypothetical protein
MLTILSKLDRVFKPQTSTALSFSNHFRKRIRDVMTLFPLVAMRGQKKYTLLSEKWQKRIAYLLYVMETGLSAPSFSIFDCEDFFRVRPDLKNGLTQCGGVQLNISYDFCDFNIKAIKKKGTILPLFDLQNYVIALHNSLINKLISVTAEVNEIEETLDEQLEILFDFINDVFADALNLMPQLVEDLKNSLLNEFLVYQVFTRRDPPKISIEAIKFFSDFYREMVTLFTYYWSYHLKKLPFTIELYVGEFKKFLNEFKPILKFDIDLDEGMMDKFKIVTISSNTTTFCVNFSFSSPPQPPIFVNPMLLELNAVGYFPLDKKSIINHLINHQEIRSFINSKKLQIDQLKDIFSKMLKDKENAKSY